MEPYLYHGIRFYNYDLLIKIIQSGYIVPRCELEQGLIVDRNNIFNGTKYISLCQKSLGIEDDSYYKSSFNDFIFNKPNLVLKNNNIKIIFPNNISYYDRDMMTKEEWNKIIFSDGEERTSYYIDEVQTKERISLKDNLIAIGIPICELEKNYNEKYIKELLNKIKTELINKELNVPIINSSISGFADNEECIKKYILK